MDHIDFHFGSADSQGSEHKMDGVQSPGEIQLIFYDGDKFSSFKDAYDAATPASADLATVSYMMMVKEDYKNKIEILKLLFTD